MEITSIQEDSRPPSFPITIIKKQQIQQQQRRRSRRRLPKAAGCCCWTRPRQGGQGRRDRARPEQAKARHNKQASQAKHCFCDHFQALWAGWLVGILDFFPKCAKKGPGALGGPGGPWGGLGGPGGPIPPHFPPFPPIPADSMAPIRPYWALLALKGCCAVGHTSGAIYLSPYL